ncbi:iron-containing alcohol dehydrogenase [Limnobacter humi]|uniref:Iron-containing alcohol dehydrogenase n=1 Tax=Limnobacter humi TaxID=1778671 RepID=A0ABT1WES7_9BURK|nr:iron-containing alcohol dehydrogenase [Limnobacter humi]MCQ8895889.1 iron-containing alcohol dehydrogenase [Limnobacter humi]
MAPFEFRTVHRLVCESGSALRLPDILTPLLSERGLNAARLFVLVDPFIQTTSTFQTIVASLQAKGHPVQVCSDVEPDPPEALVLRVADEAKAFQADLIVAIGGGSTLDVAKLIAVLAKGKQALQTMYGVGNVHSDRLPLVLLPTTAGTGSEVTPISIVTTGADTKMGVVSPVLYGDVAVLDADWTLSLPQHVTAATGIDAMVHAIEAYTSKRLKNPYADFLACEALRLLAANLHTVCREPGNREARQVMMLGACMAGQAFANAPVGGVHALAYPIGGIFHVPHGLSNSLVLPHVLSFNKPAAVQWYAELAVVVGLGSRNEPETLLADRFIDWTATLSPSTGLPVKLRDVGIAEKDLDTMAQAAMLQTRLLSNNPREIDQAAARAIYAAAY